MVEALTIMSGQILTALYNIYVFINKAELHKDKYYKFIFNLIKNTVLKNKNIPVPQIIKLDLI